jgi:hypothetical protein
MGASIWLAVGAKKTSVAQSARESLGKHRWKDRILLHWSFPEERFLEKQQKEAAKFREGIGERDLVLYYLSEKSGLGPKGSLSVDFAGRLRMAYRLPEKSAGWLLIGKDGTEKARGSGLPDWPAIFERIDQMPMRRREMRRREP